MRSTPNFFFERWSSPGRPGGPWQAALHGASVYVYFFIHDMTYFTFQVKPLIAHLEASCFDLVNVHNKGYVTQGYKVNRDSVAALYEPYIIQLSKRRL